MSQPDTDKALDAHGRSRETEFFVRMVKAATRRKHTSEGEDSYRAGGVSPGGGGQRAVSAGGDQAPFLICMDQGAANTRTNTEKLPFPLCMDQGLSTWPWSSPLNSFLLCMDPGVHGGWEGEAGPGHVERRYPAGGRPTQERERERENVELK